jgi:hypothetical protein
MWDELVNLMADFGSAVLAGPDASGYPFSLRCQPEPDAAAHVLRVRVPAYANIRPGPAGLLCHKHDEALWKLKSFIVRGSLEQDAQGWLFRPQQLIPGAGIGGLIGMLKFLRDGRRNARQYLDKRGLARPSIAWDEIHALWAEIKRAE